MVYQAKARPPGWKDGPPEVLLGQSLQNPEHMLALIGQ